MRGTGVILNLALALLTACTAVTTPRPLITPSPAIVTAPTSTPLTVGDEAGFAQEKERMVIETIERRGITDEHVLRAMRAVPRHLFVPEDKQDYAYGDYPIPAIARAIRFGGKTVHPTIPWGKWKETDTYKEWIEINPFDK